MKKILGVFRGFPGLGRVVAGVSLLETLRDDYDCNVRLISYLQGNKYLESRGYVGLPNATSMDYCSIGLLPTNKMGAYIHTVIRDYMPEVILIDGEPLILQSIKISHPNIKIITLLNPADVSNTHNDKEAMDFFNALYSLSDMAIVHGLRMVENDHRYKNLISINTIIRREILTMKNMPSKNIYCVLGGGTVNVAKQFEDSTLRIGELCLNAASLLPDCNMHIICSCQNIFMALKKYQGTPNVRFYNDIISPQQFYSDAGLVITRSGRNTLSELAFLGIPAISFVSGCTYRRVEQSNNLDDLNTTNIVSASIDMSAELFARLCLKLIGKKIDSFFQCGNDEAIKHIMQI